MQDLNHELPLDTIHEFLNEELNAAFKKGGIMQSSYGTVEMSFHDSIKNYYVLVITDYELKNRAEIITRINTAIRMISNKKTKTLYLVFNCHFTYNDLKYFSNAFPGNTINIAIYDSRSIKDKISSSKKIDESPIISTNQTFPYTHEELQNKKSKEILEKTDNIDFENLALQADFIAIINRLDKNYWWINASKIYFNNQPIKVNDIYKYPIKGRNNKRRANFSNLKIGDLLVGYDTRGRKEVYSILCVVREDNSFVFLKVIYILDTPISWKQIGEIESYFNSIIIRSKVSAPLNKLNREQFIDILLFGISNLDQFIDIVTNPEHLLFDQVEYFEVVQDIFEVENEKKSSVFEKNTPSIATFSKDTPEGIDYLDIQEDVDAFSKVMALKDLPTPLSIALFGAWGSGKSFFMNKLEERIQELIDPENPDNDVFCKNIIHIKFNAWAYLDANLWASLASIIFEKIHNHLEGITNVNIKVQNKIKEVTNKLEIVKDEKQKILMQIDVLNKDHIEIEQIIKSKKTEHNKLVKNIHSKSKTEIIKRVFSRIKAQKKVNDIISENNLQTFVQSTSDSYSELIKITNELEKIPFSFSGIFSKKVKRYLISFSIVIIIFLALSFLFDLSFFNKSVLLIPELILSALAFTTPILVQVSTLLKKISPAVSAINQIKVEVENQIQSEINIKEQEIEDDKLKLISLEAKIKALEMRSVNIKYEINDLTNILDKGVFFETFKTTIKDIHSSKTYKKHLGIISQLKNDFEILSELFIKQLPELDTNLKEKKFVDRIILYLDDLDRCSEEHVIAVLEAVNLLLAYPLFVVVVGVDHRWVKNALITKHHRQFGVIEELKGYERIEPSSYLEKIFQIPFHLNTPKKENVKYMISKLVEKDENQSHKNRIELDPEKKGAATILFDNKSNKTKTVEYKKQVIDDQLHVKVYLSEYDSKMLILTDDEIKLLPEFDFLLGTNPRAIKRYVNIYRIVRAHGDLPQLENNEQQKAVCMFLVALAIGECKSAFHKLSEMWHDDVDHFRPINTLFDNTGIENKMRYHIEKNDKIKFLLDLNDFQIRNIGLFIERFSFKNYKIEQSSHN